MIEETTTEQVASELVAEPAPVQPEPVVVEETLQPTPEATADTATAQPVEPLDPEPVLEPQLAPEPMLEPVIETTASTFPISRARELLIKAREVVQFRKRKKLEKIMSLFLKQSSITNDDVQKHVYVSDATATRYLQQLEREGRIKKENAGKYLSYSRM